MENEILRPMASETAHPAITDGLRATGIILAGSALVAICSHITLPLWFTPVPLTLQPFAVVLLGLLLRPRLAAATLGAYLAEGGIGLPVFAPGLAFGAGLAHLLGPTGGYLMSYPAAAALIAYLWQAQRPWIFQRDLERNNGQCADPALRVRMAGGVDPWGRVVWFAEDGVCACRASLPARRCIEGRGSSGDRQGTRARTQKPLDKLIRRPSSFSLKGSLSQ